MFSKVFKFWDERRVEGRDNQRFQTVGAAIWNQREPKWRLVRGTYKLADENDRNVREGTSLCNSQIRGTHYFSDFGWSSGYMQAEQVGLCRSFLLSGRNVRWPRRMLSRPCESRWVCLSVTSTYSMSTGQTNRRSDVMPLHYAFRQFSVDVVSIRRRRHRYE